MKSALAICLLSALLGASFFALQDFSLAAVHRSNGEQKALSPLAEQLISLENQLADAQKKRDRDFYARTLTADFISIGTDGKTHAREEILGDLPSTELAEYRPYDIQVVPLNEGAAVVTYDVIIRMVHYDDETPRYQHISSIWVKQGNDWKLRFQQATAAR
jgi:hypothetical protein